MSIRRQQLVRQRRTAGYSQERLAAELEVDRCTVARWERGESEPHACQRSKITEALQVSLAKVEELLAEGRQFEQAENPGSQTAAGAIPASGLSPAAPLLLPTGQAGGAQSDSGVPILENAGTIPPLAEILRVPDELLTWLAAHPELLTAATSGLMHGKGTDVLTAFFCWLAEMKRRGFMTAAAAIAGLTGSSAFNNALASPAAGGLSVFSGLDPDEQERMAGVVVSPSRVDARVIEQVETILQACKRQEDTFGPQAVLNTVLDQQRFVRSLLAECPASLRPRLLSLNSSIHTSAGWCFFDLNNFELAWRHCEQARLNAHEARDTERSIYILCLMSYVASWHGKTHVGIDYAMAAQGLATRTDDVLLKTCVADKAAMSNAVDGQYDQCMAELDKVQTLLTDSAGQASSESPAYYYNDGLLANLKSEYMLRLGRPQEAVASARAGLALYDKSFARDLSFCMLHLGKALVQSKEIDEAVTVIGDTVDLAAQNRSARLVKELHTTRASMQPWQDTPAVKELDERLKEYGLVPA